MKKRLGFATLALGAALAVLTPATAMARDRDDYRGGGNRGWGGRDRQEFTEHRERDFHDRGENRRGWRPGVRFGFGYYNAPRVVVNPPANGYYDQYGNWHAYAPQGYYDQYGNWRQY